MDQLSQLGNFNLQTNRYRQKILKNSNQRLSGFSKVKHGQYNNPQNQEAQRIMKQSQILSRFKQFYECLPDTLNLDANSKKQLDNMWSNLEQTITDSQKFESFIDNLKKQKLNSDQLSKLSNASKQQTKNDMDIRNTKLNIKIASKKQNHRSKSQIIQKTIKNKERSLSVALLNKKPTLKQNKHHIKIVADILLMGHHFLTD